MQQATNRTSETEKQKKLKKEEVILSAFFKDGTLVPVDLDDKVLQAKIKSFRRQCDKYYVTCWIEDEINEPCLGIEFMPQWEDKYGFTFQFMYHEPYFSSRRGHHTTDEWIEGFKQQIKMVKKARHNLAKLIRLKERLKLPGPIQEIRDRSDQVGFRYFVLTQEEIDEILKY